MKKTIILLCALYASNSLAMNAARARAAAMVTAPIVAPGSYYYYRSTKTTPENEEFRPFVTGVTYGMIPIINVCGMFFWMQADRFDQLERWKNHCEPRKIEKSPRDKATEVGLMSGASIYLTIPLAVKLLRKMPK